MNDRPHNLLGDFGSTDELANEPPINWLIDRWLPARELSVLYGAPGTFKSFIAQGWSCQLAKDNHRVIYIAAEGISGLRPRIDAYRAKHYKHQDEPMKMWHYFSGNVWLDDPNMRQAWIDRLIEYLNPGAGAAAAAKLPELIIVDTLARNFMGDENSAREMGMFIDGIERIRRVLDTAVLIVHHTVKGDKRVERGTEALRAASFAMFRTSAPTTRPRRGGGSVLLECDRMKDGEPPNEVRLDFDRVDLETDEHGDVYRYSLAARRFPPPSIIYKRPAKRRKRRAR